MSNPYDEEIEVIQRLKKLDEAVRAKCPFLPNFYLSKHSIFRRTLTIHLSSRVNLYDSVSNKTISWETLAKIKESLGGGYRCDEWYMPVQQMVDYWIRCFGTPAPLWFVRETGSAGAVTPFQREQDDRHEICEAGYMYLKVNAPRLNDPANHNHLYMAFPFSDVDEGVDFLMLYTEINAAQFGLVAERREYTVQPQSSHQKSQVFGYFKVRHVEGGIMNAVWSTETWASGSGGWPKSTLPADNQLIWHTKLHVPEWRPEWR